MVDRAIRENRISRAIESIQAFLHEDQISIEFVLDLGVCLDELFPNDEVIKEFVVDTATYDPVGGEFLHDLNSMKTVMTRVKALLEKRCGA